MATLSENQRVHYERVHSAYVAHYYDASSLAYRREFILNPLLSGALIDFNRSHVADLACGSGYNSAILKERFPGVRCAGFDISPSACADYRRINGWDAYEVDLTKFLDTGDVGGPYDAAMIIGGLHHCVADLSSALRNAAALLRPGGLFFMMEPNNQYFLESVRRLWYRLDSSFDAATEAALDHDVLAEMGAPWFRTRDVRYCGGPAFFLIQNSMITRVPLWLKPKLAPALFRLERAYARLAHRRFHAFFTAVWERNDHGLLERN
jgi:SAM-dependent methyltransferase